MKSPGITACGLMVALVLVSMSACGGGGSSSPSQPPPPPPALTITTPSLLPGTLQSQPYTATLAAANGVGALKWSIAPVSSTALFVTGLSIDPNTGVLSGTADFGGTGGFTATVTDSASPPRSATKSFTITATTPLQVPAAQNFATGEFQDVSGLIHLTRDGGVEPITYTVTGGSLPFGLKLDSQTALVRGSTTTAGTYVSTVTIQDSYSPPEIATTRVTIQVIPPPLTAASSVPQQILLNRPFSGRVVAIGGIPPYKFATASGSMPPGLSAIDPSSGQFNGTPTTLGSYTAFLNVTDSSPTPQTASTGFNITVVNPLGRNDSVATATPIDNGLLNATISPYIDPPDGAPVAGDNDYYKLVCLSASVVTVQVLAANYYSGSALDPVLEIVDGNGNILNTCRQPGDTSTNFASICVNDDIDVGNTDSALDFKVPGSANAATSFYVRVLDWRGDARPDLRYGLEVSGVVSPLSITSTSLQPAARSFPYSAQLSGANGIGAISWILASGTLPPGLTLSSAGAIAGTPTTDGNFHFAVTATDAGTPPQTATANELIRVAEPLKITSPAIWPDACVNQPYTFAVQTTGGLPPFFWGFYGYWVAINLDQSTGVFSGTADVTGTFNGTVSVYDATPHGDSQNVTLTIKQCP